MPITDRVDNLSLLKDHVRDIVCDMKLVFDTDVVVAGVRSPRGASAELLRLARRGLLRPVVTVPLVIEYEAVLMRSEHLVASGLKYREVEHILDVLIAVSAPTLVDFHYRPQVRDPDDEIVLEAAINGEASTIVTFNRRDFGDAPARFGIRCLRPGELLQELK